MKPVEWGYLRKNCTSCDRARDYFSREGIEVIESADARKDPIPAAQVSSTLRGIREVWVTRGKKVVHYDLSSAAGRAEVEALVVGPSGNLRAPSVKVGTTLLVGFDEETYRNVLGNR